MSVISQFRSGTRSLLRQPGLAALAVVALGLGIGLTATMFSIIHGAFLRGLPFEDAERIVTVGQIDVTDPDPNDSLSVDQLDFAEWRDAQQSFEVFAAFYGGTVNVSDGGGQPERFDGAFMTGESFDVIRAQAAMGRPLQDSDDAPSAAPVVVIGDPIWKNRYDSDPGILGRQIRVNGRPTTVVGVMPPGFRFPLDADIWVPLKLDDLRGERRTLTALTAFGRLRPDVTPDEAQAEFVGLLDLVCTSLSHIHPNVIVCSNTRTGVLLLNKHLCAVSIRVLFCVCFIDL